MGRTKAASAKAEQPTPGLYSGPASRQGLSMRAEREQERHILRGSLRLQISSRQMAKVKEDLYAKCAKKRKMLAWVKCPKFILDPLIERIITMGGITEKTNFIDIGSGIGNVVESVATRVGCDCTGVELVKEHHDVALAAKPLFDRYRQQHKLRKAKTTFVNSDITKADTSLFKDADVIWCANKLFPLMANCYLIDLFKRLRPGVRVFVMSNLFLHHRPECRSQEESFKYFTFTDWTWGAGDVEWTDEAGKLYMYTRTAFVDPEEGL